MRSAERAALDRLLATAGIAKDDIASALDATIRPGHALAKHGAATARAGRPAATTVTGPFLPSITLAEGTTSEAAAPTTADAVGGAPVVWTALACSTTPASAALAALVASTELAANDPSSPAPALTMTPVASLPNTMLVCGLHQYLVRGDAVVVDAEIQIRGAGLIGGRSYVRYDTADETRLSAFDSPPDFSFEIGAGS